MHSNTNSNDKLRMMDKALNFMLIDDNGIDLFVNQKCIEKVVGDAEIIAFMRATKAIDFLRSLPELPTMDFLFIPDIILLDINMPEMNGFEFLDAFSRIQNTHLTNTRIYMLSSSTSLRVRIDADMHNACEGFLSKPLSYGKVTKIMEELEAKQKHYQFQK